MPPIPKNMNTKNLIRDFSKPVDIDKTLDQMAETFHLQPLEQLDELAKFDPNESLYEMGKLAGRAGLPMPEVAIYEGEPNAFATGPSKKNSLVAVSTGLLQSMTREEAEAVLAHEVAHIANGDMVTLTLIQGVVNTFVIFISKVIAFAVDNFLRKNDEASSGPGIAYMVTSIVCEIVFGVLASIIVAWFSRQREFRADAGAAGLMGSPVPMQNALRRLGGLHTEPLPQGMAASGIAGGMGALFSTHPPLEERIAALGSR